MNHDRLTAAEAAAIEADTGVTITGAADAIDDAARKAMRAHDRLHKLMRRHCPGPHEFVQHRDMRPPWCSACLRTNDGRRVERD